MRVFDVTLTLRPDMVLWPDEPGPTYAPIAELIEGDSANVTQVGFGSHTGTHVDAPSHFLEGARTVDKLDPWVLVGPAYVVDVADAPVVSRSILEAAGIHRDVRRLIIRTGNTQFWNEEEPAFHADYVAVDESGADWLLERGVRLVGIDYLSIEPFKLPGHPVHRKLLEAETVILEGLDLRGVPVGDCEIFCGPLKLQGIDGSPARVILVRRDLD